MRVWQVDSEAAAGSLAAAAADEALQDQRGTQEGAAQAAEGRGKI